MFSPIHILLIIFTIVSVPLISRYLVNKEEKTQYRFLSFLAVIIVFFDPAYWVWEYLTFGKFHFNSTLPLYLCSLFWILLPIAVFVKTGYLKQTALSNIATVGLIAGILGFVFNYHIDVYPMTHFVSIRTLLYHYLMILGSFFLWHSKFYIPQAGDQIRAFIPVWILLIPSLILNYLYQYDYGYTNGGQGTQLTILSDHMSKPLFLLVLYSVFFLMVWLLFYFKCPLFKKQDKSKNF